MILWQALLALGLFWAYAEAWLLAIRVVTRDRLGLFAWMPAAYAAFGVPMMVVEWMAMAGRRERETAFLVGWAALPAVILGVWGLVRWRRSKARAGDRVR